MNTRQNNRSKKLVQRSNTPDALENGHSQDALCTSQKLEQVPSHDAPKPLAQIVDMNERREEQEGARGKKNRLEIIDENDAPVPLLECIANKDMCSCKDVWMLSRASNSSFSSIMLYSDFL